MIRRTFRSVRWLQYPAIAAGFGAIALLILLAGICQLAGAAIGWLLPLWLGLSLGGLLWLAIRVDREFRRLHALVPPTDAQPAIADQLRQINDELELRIAERTAELLQTNQRLQRELEERQLIQASLQASQAQFAGILNIAEDAIISINMQQQITLFNQGAERIFGYTAAEAIGQPLNLLLPDRYAAAHQHHVSDFRTAPTAARRMGERREIYGRRKDGSEFPAEASISKFDVGQGTVFTVFLRDITERKQIDRMKDEFVSVVSHELRTPLTSIHGSLGMLASGLLKPDSERGRRMLKIAVDSTDRLVRLINDILDIERIESGRVKMEKEQCQVTDLVQEAINIVQPLADQAQITLAVSHPPVLIWADPDRIVQTLTNLLSNAIKFSLPGNIVWLTVTLPPHPPSQPVPSEMLLFTVKDQGRGIPTDKLDSIFERFQQVDSSDSRDHEGTGLGLAICRSIVQQHDGQIWVDSTLGQGSTFYFTLPLLHPLDWVAADQAHAGTELGTMADPHAPDVPLVLVCDDDPPIRSVLQTLLEQHQYRVITAESGSEAIAQAIHQQPNVILLDLQMPGMNGWETMSQLKDNPDTQQIPIIICSIYSPAEADGHPPTFVNWVSKPLDETLLLRSLQAALAKPADQIRVLIVEDDVDLAHVLVTLFEQHNMQAFHATTGRDAIRLSQTISPDLLILDVVLPEGDGFTVVEWLRQHNRLHDVPLVVYSARDLDAAERDRLRLGQTEFLDKGRGTIQEFEQRVMQLLQQVTQSSP